MSRFDAVVTLGGGIDAKGELTSSSKDRISVATSLYFQGLANKIIISGKWWHRIAYQPTETEACTMARLALQSGVPPSNVFIEEKSTDTISNAFFIKTEILEPQEWKNIALVTCPSHQARTKMIFEHVLGPDYTLTNYPTLTISGPEELAKEAVKIRVLQSHLMDIMPGDDQAIASRFQYIGSAALLGHQSAE